MKRVAMSLLILLCAVLFLSVYSEDIYSAKGSTDNKYDYASKEGNRYVYSYSCNNITELNIDIQNAEINIYVNSDSESIIIYSDIFAIEGKRKEKSLDIKCIEENKCVIDIVIPNRVYTYNIKSENIEIENKNDIRGIIKINTGSINAFFSEFGGKLDINSNEGYVDVKGGNLRNTSNIVINQKGNIYLDTVMSDTSDKYYIYTKEGTVKISTDKMEQNTVFDVYSLITKGEFKKYSYLDNRDENKILVEVVSENGIVIFR